MTMCKQYFHAVAGSSSFNFFYTVIKNRQALIIIKISVHRQPIFSLIVMSMHHYEID